MIPALMGRLRPRPRRRRARHIGTVDVEVQLDSGEEIGSVSS
ncbi:MAG: hypothetical protein R2705_10630 [Ilumatobacteraceae bacterium]